MAKHKIVSLKKSVGEVIQIGAELAFTWMKEEEGVLIDVREQEELEVEWIPGVTAMPLSLFNPSAIEGIGANKLIFICQTGRRSIEAAERMLSYGIFEVYNVKDGLLAWNAAGLESIDQSALLI